MKCSKISRNCVVTNKKLRGNYLFSSQFLIGEPVCQPLGLVCFQNFLIGVHLKPRSFFLQRMNSIKKSPSAIIHPKADFSVPRQ